jgi:hypothetical protein
LVLLSFMYSRVNNATHLFGFWIPPLSTSRPFAFCRITMAKARRDKKDTKAAISSSNSKNNISNKNKSNFVDQLDRASAQLQMAGQRIGQLHSQWKSYLSGLSYVVIYLSFYQLRSRINTCHGHFLALMLAQQQVQEGNGINNVTDDYSRWWTMARIMGVDAAALAVGLVLAILLCFFLRRCINAVARFSHPIYRTAQIGALTATVLYAIRTTTLLLQLRSTFSSSGVAHEEVEDKEEAQLSCLDPAVWTDEMRTSIVTAHDKIPFPCAIVFHVIVALSLYFMNYQRQHHMTNVQKVDGLRNELQIKKGEAKKNK